jgi:predicted dehydrogenase
MVSRNPEPAKAKLESLGYSIPVLSFDQALADPNIDLIYVASPHSEHYRMTAAALEAGKHVLCEKAFMMNAAEARQAKELAKGKGLFLMEAMWTKFNPLLNHLREVVDSGRIGELKLIQVNFGRALTFDPGHRLFSAELGGGTALDQGVYVMTFLRWFANSGVKSISTVGQRFPNGTDALAVSRVEFENGILGQAAHSLSTNIGTKARLIGDKGVIEIDSFFWSPEKATITIEDNDVVREGPTEIYVPKDGMGYSHMIREVSKAILSGQTEVPAHPVQWSIETMELLDEIRAQIPQNQ